MQSLADTHWDDAHPTAEPMDLASSEVADNSGASGKQYMLYRRFMAMLEREKAAPSLYTSNAWYKKYRRTLVDWISEVATELNFEATTGQAAIATLDLYLGSLQGTMNRKNLQLAATACILVASKMEEMEKDVPATQVLNECTDNSYTEDLIRQMELHVLKTIGWSTHQNDTAAHFLSAFMCFQEARVSSADLLNGAAILDFQYVQVYFERYAQFFIALSSQDYEFLRFKRSLVAAASICAAREAVGITPVWTEGLTQMTGYSLPDIEPCVTRVWDLFTAEFGDDSVPKRSEAGSPVNAVFSLHALDE